MDRLMLTHEDVHHISCAIAQGPHASTARIVKTAFLAQHASSRAYFRVWLEGLPDAVSSVVVMKMGADPLRSDEITAGERPLRNPFVDVGEFLSSHDVPVVRLLVDLSDQQLLVLEDLGDEPLLHRLQETPRLQWSHWYCHAIDILANLHAAGFSSPASGCLAFRRRFDAALLRWELDHGREYLLEARGHSLTASERAFCDEAFGALARRLAALPQGLTHRDFQSRNLMVTPTGLRVIDFQDALIAPVPYDLVALLNDSYVALDEAFLSAMIDHYLSQRRAIGLPTMAHDEFLLAFHLQTVQRKWKDSGRFVFIDRVKGNASFLSHIPQSVANFRRSLTWLAQNAASGNVCDWAHWADICQNHVPEWSGSA